MNFCKFSSKCKEKLLVVESHSNKKKMAETNDCYLLIHHFSTPRPLLITVFQKVVNCCCKYLQVRVFSPFTLSVIFTMLFYTPLMVNRVTDASITIVIICSCVNQINPAAVWKHRFPLQHVFLNLK